MEWLKQTTILVLILLPLPLPLPLPLSLTSPLALAHTNKTVAPATAATKRDQLSSALNANNYIRTKRMLTAAIRKPIPAKAKAAKSWYRALFALVTLERLVGSKKQALRYFSQCHRDKNTKIGCADIASLKEWRAMRNWACRKEPLPEPCVKPLKNNKSPKSPR